ncbi:MAG: heme-binding protein [Pseudobacteriovorax sp.]|nr:heme-binding protein [Pseudobacteriovorax sp.]
MDIVHKQQIVIPLLSLFLASCSVFGIRHLEEPRFTLVSQQENIEIRDYQSYLVAKTKVEGSYSDSQSKAFRRLASYIFGDNQSQSTLSKTTPQSTTKNYQSIAMTAPVNQEVRDNSFFMSFMMPSKFSIDTLPVPDDDRIWFETVNPKTMAVIQFTWLASETRYQAYEQKLLTWLDQQGTYEPVGTANYAGYDPPWTIPFLRTNEVMIEVRRR